jgi:predicted lactoylglutathione lyase
MTKNIIIFVLIATSFAGGYFLNSVLKSKDDKTSIETVETSTNEIIKNDNMKLGAFSVSLAVKDIHVSKAFYENLGFSVFGGSLEQNYLIMKNETTLIGLFQGMFEETLLTFNPGWDSNAQNIEDYQDVRDIQKSLKNSGIELINETDENANGPGSFMVKDPDGNIILFDQHI